MKDTEKATSTLVSALELLQAHWPDEDHNLLPRMEVQQMIEGFRQGRLPRIQLVAYEHIIDVGSDDALARCFELEIIDFNHDQSEKASLVRPRTLADEQCSDGACDAMAKRSLIRVSGLPPYRAVPGRRGLAPE